MFEKTFESDANISMAPDLDEVVEQDARPSRLVDKVLIRPQGVREISISWKSDSEDARSWIFLNGKLAVGPFMAETKNRSVILPVPGEKTFKIEVHDFYGDGATPNSVEELPQVKPLISWNAVPGASCYRIYHTIFDTGSIESLLVQVPPLSMDRMEIDCPIRLSGGNGKRSNAERFGEGEADRDGTASSWHYFRVETVDQFGNESENEVVPYFAADLPSPPELSISRDTQSGLLSFRIIQ